MYALPITYEDFNGVPRKETFYFNYKKSELLEMESSTYGGFAERCKKIVDSPDTPLLHAIFKDFILGSYGILSEDGKKHLKSPEISHDFESTNAYDELIVSLLSDPNKAMEFLRMIVPAEMRDAIKGVTPDNVQAMLEQVAAPAM